MLSEEARSVVRALAVRHPCAIVSGRARTTAIGFVQLDELYYAGSHGFDITGPMRRQTSEGGPDEEGVLRPTLSYQVAG